VPGEEVGAAGRAEFNLTHASLSLKKLYAQPCECRNVISMLNRNVPSVVVPRDPESMELLYRSEAWEADLIMVPIDREQLRQIFSSGLIKKINDAFGIMIDEYEEDDIVGGDQIKIFKQILSDFRNETSDLTFIDFFLVKFEMLADKALELNTGIFFEL
jgi:hypothetical protein